MSSIETPLKSIPILREIENCRKKDNCHIFENENNYIFPSELLSKVIKDDTRQTLINAGSYFQLRPLCHSDYNKGYIDLLSKLTDVGNISKDMFIDRFNSMKDSCNTYYIIVLEDQNIGKIIGTGSLVIEQKFIHETGFRGRIEDIVVSENYRGKKFGKLILDTITRLGKYLGVYKLSLECTKDLMNFYSAAGYHTDKNTYMVLRFDGN